MDNILTSPANPKVKKVVELHRKKGRKQSGLYIIEGHHLIEEALKHDITLEQLFVVEAEVAPHVDCPVYYVTVEVMKKLATTETPQPILGVAHIPSVKTSSEDKVLYLDNLQDPGNVGTILRSAVAFGLKHVVLSPDCVDIFEPKVVRSAQGAHFQLTFDVCSDEQIKTRYDSHQVVVTSLEDAVSLTTFIPNEKWLLVVGNEGNGVRQSLKQLADQRICIDSPGMESLNVAVATSICLYEFTKK